MINYITIKIIHDSPNEIEKIAVKIQEMIIFSIKTGEVLVTIR